MSTAGTKKKKTLHPSPLQPLPHNTNTHTYGRQKVASSPHSHYCCSASDAVRIKVGFFFYEDERGRCKGFTVLSRSLDKAQQKQNSAWRF